MSTELQEKEFLFQELRGKKRRKVVLPPNVPDQIFRGSLIDMGKTKKVAKTRRRKRRKSKS